MSKRRGKHPVFYHPVREIIVSPMIPSKFNFRPIGRKLKRGEAAGVAFQIADAFFAPFVAQETLS